MHVKVFLLLFAFVYCKADEKILNGVMAVVNGEKIFYSDVSDVVLAMKYSSNGKSDDVSELKIFDDIVAQKLIITSNKDLLGNDHVKMQIDLQMKMIEKEVVEHVNKMLSDYFGNDRAAFVAEVGCSVDDYIENAKNVNKSQMMYVSILRNLIGDIYVSPVEVKTFYDSVKDKSDILPVVEKHYELGEIEIFKKENEKNRKKIFEIDKKFKDLSVVKNKKDKKNIKREEVFDKVKAEYGDSYADFGEWDIMKIDYRIGARIAEMWNGEVSDVIDTDDGFYIVRVLESKDGVYKLDGFFLQNNDVEFCPENVKDFLKEVRGDIMSGKIEWKDAVRKYSQNEKSNVCEGRVLGGKGDERVFEGDICKEEVEAIKNLKEKEISEPFVVEKEGKKSYKIVFVIKKTEKHVADLKNDYELIEGLAKKEIEKKKMEEFKVKFLKDAEIELNFSFPVCREWYKTIN